jgi:hypothetical protein
MRIISSGQPVMAAVSHDSRLLANLRIDCISEPGVNKEVVLQHLNKYPSRKFCNTRGSIAFSQLTDILSTVLESVQTG